VTSNNTFFTLYLKVVNSLDLAALGRIALFAKDSSLLLTREEFSSVSVSKLFGVFFSTLFGA
jgi:hypothetical protein